MLVAHQHICSARRGAVSERIRKQGGQRCSPWAKEFPLLPESTEYESAQRLFGNIRGKLMFGRVGATSATEIPMLPFTGVARKAWMLPASGPLSRIALPEICPRSLILLAMVAKRLALAGNSELRSGEAVNMTPLPPPTGHPGFLRPGAAESAVYC